MRVLKLNVTVDLLIESTNLPNGADGETMEMSTLVANKGEDNGTQPPPPSKAACHGPRPLRSEVHKRFSTAAVLLRVTAATRESKLSKQ